MNDFTGAIPVVDLFAGPGGLGEGFSSLTDRRGNPLFHVCLSIEKDLHAHRTLLLRSFFRQFPRDSVPGTYYRYLRREVGQEALFKEYPEEWERAKAEAWLAELGKEPHDNVISRIKQTLGDAEWWVLIGGPPCQAYSIMGRSRMRPVDPKKFDRDTRHYLYKEYLRILADHRPPIFVMENVKGILSSTVGGKRIFQQILADLQCPVNGTYNGSQGKLPHYRIFSLVKPRERLFEELFEPTDFVIESENYGIPQTRHRVILLGIRSDLSVTPETLKRSARIVAAARAITGLPKLRSGLSRIDDSNGSWLSVLQGIKQEEWFNRYADEDYQVWSQMDAAVGRIREPRCGTGGEYIRAKTNAGCYPRWYLDARLGGVCNHTARCHMESDLFRYLFAACFAKVNRRSPELKDFPEALLPEHENVRRALDGEDLFDDRFHVQLREKPACTITSHMAKDGHYYIHPDPTQCRSLTVREAARLQTFPDNYYFEGSRTQQYKQVGNAVPPLLARQISKIVYNALMRAREALEHGSSKS